MKTMEKTPTISAVKNWKVLTPPPTVVDEIVTKLGLTRPVATVLANRGVSGSREAREFLTPDITGMYSPFLLPGIFLAVARIRRALDNNEKILVYGDRDVDGVTSIAVMVRTLRSLGADPLWYIPSDEGYGVHNEIIDRYAAEGVTLVITVDCGISAVEQTEHARAKGIDIVVTDHHEPPATGLPKAVAVVDPKRADSRYPFSDLAGCAVAYKVAEALMATFGKYYDEEMIVLELATTGPDPRTDTIVEIAALKVQNGVVREQLLLPIEAEPKQALERLASFSGASRLIVHDAVRTQAFIERLIPGFCGPQRPSCRDVLALAERHVPSRPDSLNSLVIAMGLEVRPVKTALDTAHLTQNIYHRLEWQDDLRMKFYREGNLDLIALGTIADIMPLIKENRLLVHHGLKALENSRKVGVKALLEHCVNKSKSSGLTAKSISWSITPLLNAAGRRGKAALSAELLLTESPSTAEKLLDEIAQLNAERKELQAENLEKFLPLLSEQCDLVNDKIFVVTATGIEHGVTGIIASQIMRQYCRPTVLLIIEGEQAMGAARSIEGFDMVGALSRVSDILIKYGGHSQAAGLTVLPEHLPELRRRLKAIADDEISPEAFVPTIIIDDELQPSDVTQELVTALAAMEPFGMGNPHPVFMLRKMKIREHSRLGNNGDHLKLRVSRNGGGTFSALGWGMGALDEDISEAVLLDLAVQLEMNVWQDRQSVQMVIQDFKPSA